MFTSKTDRISYGDLSFVDEAPSIVTTAMDNHILEMTDIHKGRITFRYWPMTGPSGATYILSRMDRSDDNTSYISLAAIQATLKVIDDGFEERLESHTVLGMHIAPAEEQEPQELYERLIAAIKYHEFDLHNGTVTELLDLCQAVADIYRSRVRIAFAPDPEVIVEGGDTKGVVPYIQLILDWFKPSRYIYEHVGCMDDLNTPFKQTFLPAVEANNHDIVEKTRKLEEFCAGISRHDDIVEKTTKLEEVCAGVFRPSLQPPIIALKSCKK